MLNGRTLSELQAVAKKIEAVDFKNGHKIYTKIEKNMQGLKVGVLVKNVGISYALSECFIMLLQQIMEHGQLLPSSTSPRCQTSHRRPSSPFT